ncbi:MAG TPA: preprotein translocase subunit SecA [Pirellulaceae bacterium]|nr:preprotein translocase subunit SecA [Pirellulaceae bacterium]
MSRFSLATWGLPWRAAQFANWRALAHRIQRRTDDLLSSPEHDLTPQSLRLKYRALSGESLDSLAVEAFALVATACQRVYGLRVYDVQLIGALAIQAGGIAEMETGEGKTLAALFPLYLNALRGYGTHLVTANDYLAERDANWGARVFAQLGLKVAAVLSSSTPVERHRAYRADITYATAKEIGFDYLRDQLGNASSPLGSSPNSNSGVQRELYFAVVDEADNILIDEARTPLVVSGSPAPASAERAALYYWAAEHSIQFPEPMHVECDVVQKRATLTEAGRRLARTLQLPPLVTRATRWELYEHLEMAIQARTFYAKDRDYVVRNGEIIIVDEGTGRLAEGRKWREGLHQAIEAREGLVVTEEGSDAAKIAIQSLFRKYARLAGMTGTASHSKRELKAVYRTAVWQIPTHRSSLRSGWPELVFVTEDEKWQAIIGEVAQLHAAGRPVLLGVRSIQKSEKASQMLTAAGIAHHVLNARHLQREAEIIACGGRSGQVTVATNMAGRGTDIGLDEEARLRGGLHVICSELHESGRIDRQLIGRCARQGDPGSYRHFHSLEDDVLRQGLSAKTVDRLKQWARSAPHRLKQAGPWFRSAQRRIERRHLRSRQQLVHLETQRHQLHLELSISPHLS